MARRTSPRRFSRRIFIHRLSFLGGGVVLLGSACRREEKPAKAKAPGIRRQNLTTSHLTFTDPEFEVLSAAVERILPADEDPGAIALGVPGYVDRMLQSPDLRQMKDDFLAGIDALDRRAGRMFQKGFADASPEQQDDLLRIFRDSPRGTGEAHFFELLVVLTMEGALGDPSYGGNRNREGWALVGFDTSEPPPRYDGYKALHAHDGKAR